MLPIGYGLLPDAISQSVNYLPEKRTTALPYSTQRIVTGRVTDAETGEPIPAASVYLAGTTVGITTGDDGVYQLKLPGQGSYELVVSHVGYESVFQKIDVARALVKLDIAMKTYEMKEIVVTKKVKKRKQDVDFFWETLLGAYPSRKIYAVNPKDVYFFYNSGTRLLKVSSRVPIQVVNQETGYRIYYTLQSFSYDYNTTLATWYGQALYEELIPENEQQKNLWQTRRKEVYSLSLNHFIRALYNGTLLQEGFLLNFPNYIIPVKSDNDSTKIESLIYLNVSSPVGSKYLLSTDSFADSKIFKTPKDSVLMLTCYGRPVKRTDIQAHFKAFSSNINTEKVGMYRHFVKCTNGQIHIFPDGTYSELLRMSHRFDSKSIAGLNVTLPIEYGMASDSTTHLIATSSNYMDCLSFIPDIDSLM